MESAAIHRCAAVIVGAGPGRAYLGYLLARQGVDVTIIDKAVSARQGVWRRRVAQGHRSARVRPAPRARAFCRRPRLSARATLAMPSSSAPMAATSASCAFSPPTAPTARFEERAVFDFGGMANGYGWILPKRDHANVGVYSPSGGKSLRAQLDPLMARHHLLDKPIRVDYRGSIIPLRNLRNHFQRGRVSLLGDAAGFAESILGEGIYFALKSASLAAQAVAECGLGGDAPRYDELVRRDLLPEHRAAGRMASLIYRFPDFAFRHLVLNERINDDFAGLISGAVGYRRCLGKTLLGFPRWLLPSRPARASQAL